MELLPLGPVVIIDTPGLDDEGELGGLRVQKARQVLDKTDIAVLVVDKTEGISALEEELVKELIDKVASEKLTFDFSYKDAKLVSQIFLYEPLTPMEVFEILSKYRYR